MSWLCVPSNVCLSYLQVLSSAITKYFPILDIAVGIQVSTYVLTYVLLYRPEILTSDGIKITNIIKICILGIGSIHGS